MPIRLLRKCLLTAFFLPDTVLLSQHFNFFLKFYIFYSESVIKPSPSLLLFERCVVIVPRPEAVSVPRSVSRPVIGPLVQHYIQTAIMFSYPTQKLVLPWTPCLSQGRRVSFTCTFPSCKCVRRCLGRRCHAQKPTTKSKCRTSFHRARCAPTTSMSARCSVLLLSARRSLLKKKNAIQVDLKTCILPPDLQIKQTPPCSVKQNSLLFNALRYPPNLLPVIHAAL